MSSNRTIGILLDDLSDCFFFGISQSMNKYAAMNNYNMLYANTGNKPAIARQALRVLRDKEVDGYIIAPTPGIDRQVQMLIKDGFPLVLFDRYLPGVDAYKVTVNNYKGTFAATSHLIDHGRKNILFITIDSGQTHMADRLKGYTDAMTYRSLPARIELVDYEMSDSSMYSRLRKAIKRHLLVDAIFFAAHRLSVNGLKVLKDLNLIIPVHLAVVGFDDDPHFSLFSPPITTVAQPIDKIASEISRLIFNNIEHKDRTAVPEDIVLDTELIIRNSSY